MGLLALDKPLVAYPRSRSRPYRRKLPEFGTVELFFNEQILWRLAAWRAKSDPSAFIAEIRRAEAELAALAEEALLAQAREISLPAAALLSPRGIALFAHLAEVMRRKIGFPLRDNQIACAIALLSGRCVELRTGEGKTYAAGYAALLAARVGVSSHVITVNEYLAKRDHEYIAPLAQALGLSSAVVLQEMAEEARQAAYDCDIVYGANKTFVFDHLRDLRQAHTDPRKAPRQMGQVLAIVDEADSVLIDDATTPMILSEQSGEVPPEDLQLFKDLADFVDALPAAAMLRDQTGGWRLRPHGVKLLELAARDWGHPLARSHDLIALAEKIMAAKYTFREGEAWVRREEGIEMIDQSTGRLMPDRKWDYGLQQAVELRAGVTPSGENRTVGQITQQSYFRQYARLGGLTGTAKECRTEFWAIYRLAIAPIAPHAPSRLSDLGLRVFRDAPRKWQAIFARARDLAQAGRAVLIGLNDVREADELAAYFEGSGLNYQVLHALNEAEEAALIEGAGAAGQITIATHLAGRGTDIAPDDSVLAGGGLHVIIGSAMASARLERQLCGRAGRKGQPGSHEQLIALTDRMLTEGERSALRSLYTLLLRWPRFARFGLARIQALRDARARITRRRGLMREQKLIRDLGYR